MTMTRDSVEPWTVAPYSSGIVPRYKSSKHEDFRGKFHIPRGYFSAKMPMEDRTSCTEYITYEGAVSRFLTALIHLRDSAVPQQLGIQMVASAFNDGFSSFLAMLAGSCLGVPFLPKHTAKQLSLPILFVGSDLSSRNIEEWKELREFRSKVMLRPGTQLFVFACHKDFASMPSLFCTSIDPDAVYPTKYQFIP